MFGIQTGVTICLLERRKAQGEFIVHYSARPQTETAEEKLSFLSSRSFADLTFTEIRPDARGGWLHQQHGGFGSLIPVSAMPGGRNRADGYIFDLSSTGIMSGRDEWVYDFSADVEAEKLAAFADVFAGVPKRFDPDQLPLEIKWSRNLKRKAGTVPSSELARTDTRSAIFRPFVRKMLSGADYLIDELGATNRTFSRENRAIAFLSVASSQPLAALAIDRPFDYGLLKTGNGGTQALYRHRYAKSGERIDNITDWVLDTFATHYGDRADVTKDAIFNYVYAVLHDPTYRETYALDLRREFPRIPFHPEFARWAAWGVGQIRAATRDNV